MLRLGRGRAGWGRWGDEKWRSDQRAALQQGTHRATHSAGRLRRAPCVSCARRSLDTSRGPRILPRPSFVVRLA